MLPIKGWEIIIIIVIIAVLFGPGIFKKFGKRIKQTGKAAQKGLESGAKNAGVDVDKIKAEAKDKTVQERVEGLQDKVDEWLDSKKEIDIEEEAPAAQKSVEEPAE